MNTHNLNAKGLKCPMPVIKLQQLVRQLPCGDQVSIECTDPAAEKDIKSWCKINRHQFISAESELGAVRIIVQVNRTKN
jgi:tRNA 2-thiouridine synthesizing protein A